MANTRFLSLKFIYIRNFTLQKHDYSEKLTHFQTNAQSIKVKIKHQINTINHNTNYAKKRLPCVNYYIYYWQGLTKTLSVHCAKRLRADDVYVHLKHQRNLTINQLSTDLNNNNIFIFFFHRKCFTLYKKLSTDMKFCFRTIILYYWLHGHSTRKRKGNRFKLRLAYTPNWTSSLYKCVCNDSYTLQNVYRYDIKIYQPVIELKNDRRGRAQMISRRTFPKAVFKKKFSDDTSKGRTSGM